MHNRSIQETADMAPPSIEKRAALNKQLFTACQAGDIETARTLLEQGANPNARNERHGTPLQVTCYYHPKNTDIIDLLLQHKADINAVKHDNGSTALLYVALKNCSNTVNHLINRGALVNVVTHDAWTPLLYGAINLNDSMTEALYEAGAILQPHHLRTLTARHYANELATLLVPFQTRVIKKIIQLFSLNINDQAFTAYLNSINEDTSVLLDRSCHDHRRVIRLTILEQIIKVECTLLEAPHLDFGKVKTRMERIAKDLVLIQKTENDPDEKTAKRKLLSLIQRLGGDKQYHALFAVLNTWLDETPTANQVEKMINTHLLKPSTQALNHQFQECIASLSQDEHQRIKGFLFKYIKKLSDNYKSEDGESDKSQRVMNAIQASYDQYNAGAFEKHETPLLFQILRIHHTGAVDANTGTWKAFMNAMACGNFNRTQPKSSSWFSWLSSAEEKVSAEQEMMPLGRTVKK